MIVYCIPDIDETSPTGDAYVGTLKEAEAIARDASKSDLRDNAFPPEGKGKEVRVERIKLRKADKAGILAFLNHEGFVVEHQTVAVFRNGRRIKVQAPENSTHEDDAGEWQADQAPQDCP